jgi:outer membrane cobalamin receptor
VSVVEIRVKGEATGEPIPSAIVTIAEVGVSSVTDESGRTVVRGLPPGLHRFRISALGYGSVGVDVAAVNGRTVRITVLLPPAPITLPGLRIAVEASEVPRGGVEVTTAGLGPTAPDLPAALERVPGVTIVQQGGPGAPSSIQLRGSGSDQVLILLDGVPLNSPLTGEVDLNSIDLASLERIVVIPGAQSARYGPRALGGVVILESKTNDRTTSNLSLSAGSWESRSASGNATWVPDPTWVISAGGHWSDAKGDFLYEVPDFRGGGEARRGNAGFRRAGGHIRVAGASERITTSLRIHLNDIDRGSPGTIAQPSLSGTQGHRRHGMSLSTEARGDRSGASLLLGLQWQQAEYRDSLPPFGQAYDQEARVAQQELGIDGWRNFGPLMLRVGGDLRRVRVRSDALTVRSTSIGEAGVWSRAEVTRPLGTGARGSLQFGLRLDHHDLVEGTSVSPSLMATLNRSGTQVEIAYRNAFSPPGLADLFFQEGVLVRANPELRPERVKGEVSATLGHQRRLSGSLIEVRASAYQADIDGMILWSPDFQFVWSPGNFDVSRRGVEIGSSLEFPVLGRTHSVSGHLAWSRVEYRGGVLTGQVAYRPVFSADLEARWDLFIGEATLRTGHLGSRRSVAGSGLNALPPYTLLDLGFSLPISLDKLEGRVDVLLSNVLDERAALLVDYPVPGRGWSTRIQISPPGLS